MICLLLLYDISMTAYLVFFHRFSGDAALGNPRFQHHPASVSFGFTKEEQRERLQKRQQQQNLKHLQQQRKKIRPEEQSDYEERDVRLQEKILESIKEGNHQNHQYHMPTSNKTVAFQRKYPRMIHFLHIHKSAGTFLCKQAFRNKMAADYGRNCNVRNDQRCCWYDAAKTDNNNNNDNNETKILEERSIDFAKTAPFDFVASEKGLSGPMLPDYYDYVVTLRNSRDRYKSHWQQLKRIAKSRKLDVKAYPTTLGWIPWIRSWMHWMHGGTSQAAQAQQPPLPHRLARWVDTGENPEDDPGHWNFTVVDQNDGQIHPVGNFTKWVIGQPDNYSVRMICGSPCVGIPKYKITTTLFEHSLEKLWVNFSHVLFVEDMEASFARFAKAYGWDTEYNDESSSSSRRNNAKKPAVTGRKVVAVDGASPFSADPYMTVLDDALYEFALRKHRAALESNNSSSSNNNNSIGSNASSSLQLLPQPRLIWRKDYPSFQNQDLVDEYFRKGPLTNCTNPCCGYCSKW